MIILYYAHFEQHWEYVFLLQGSDISSYRPGHLVYHALLEVVLVSSITPMLNYPIPFSPCTLFVFTLTSTLPPDVIRIMILSVSGRIVRVITEDEISPSRDVRDITDCAWYGRYLCVEQLAYVVYLYRDLAQT